MHSDDVNENETCDPASLKGTKNGKKALGEVGTLVGWRDTEQTIPSLVAERVVESGPVHAGEIVYASYYIN